MSLYRKYRPQNFAEIVDQDNVVKPLLGQLESGKITHAYLFSGPRGTGKTSTARIFAKAVNCEKYKGDKFGEPCNKCETCKSITAGSNFDVLELDAASNRGIDEIRDLREKVNLSPGGSRYKVYIIDEAHQLTNEAFNALLKTLEEPPAHAIFILATTEFHKIPATILSRVQKYEFRLSENTTEKFKKIDEAKSLPKESLELIAKYSGGSFRDGEVLLEKVVAVNPKAKPDEVEEILGKILLRGVGPFELILQKNTKAAVAWLQNFQGDYKVLGESLVETLRDVLLIKIGVLEKTTNKYSPEEFDELKNLSDSMLRTKIDKWIKLFSEAVSQIKDSPIPVLPLELAVVEACEFGSGEIVEEVRETSSVELKKDKVVEKKIETKPKTKEKIEVVVVETVEEPNIKTVSREDLAKIEEIQKIWADVMTQVKQTNNSLGVFLRNARPSALEENLLTLEVYYQFHKDLVEEPKNAQLISDTVEKLLGRPVRIVGKVGIRPEKSAKPQIEEIEEQDPTKLFGKLN